jgi:uncharacterized cupredoxin-like copper-binding protein
MGSEDVSTQAATMTPGRRAWWPSILLMLAAIALIVALLGACTAGDATRSESSGMPGGHMSWSTTPGSADLGAMMGGIARPAEASAADQVLQVVALDQLAFDPAVIDVVVGQTIAFEVTNSGATAHEFMLAPATMQGHHEAQMGQAHGQMMVDSPHAVTLEPGETKSITMRFMREGELEYACHVPGHYEGGMVGTVTVRDA